MFMGNAFGSLDPLFSIVVELHESVARHIHRVRYKHTDRETTPFSTTELALNMLSRSHWLICLRLLLRMQPAIWHTLIPSQYSTA